MKRVIKIGTRDSELAVWQATHVQSMLKDHGCPSTLVYIKSEGDLDLKTPLYEMGVQGIFTKSLDTALLNEDIDIAVHSMKDVPTRLPKGIINAAVLKRGNYKDLFVINDNKKIVVASKGDDGYFDYAHLKAEDDPMHNYLHSIATIATSSTRRRAQWLHRYPAHSIVNMRGNINTRLQKIKESTWDGAILAAAGLERINLKPSAAVELDWMLPAPAQGAILVVCRQGDEEILKAAAHLDHAETAQCTLIEKEFLRVLMGGCSTPISALALADKKDIYFRGNILSLDGKEKISIEKYIAKDNITGFGLKMAHELLVNGGQEIADKIRNG